MSNTHQESVFETEIVNYLTSHGWLKGSSAEYNKELALDTHHLIEWIKTSQPDQWKELEKRHNGETEKKFTRRVAKELNNRGTLDVLRHGITDLGVKFKMCQFKPASTLNSDLVNDYQQNRLSVTRQIYFSEHTNESVDLCLFINGIPVATAELKEPFTNQTVSDAIKQYRDRNHEEKLFSFKTRALVHFAVDTEEVYMTTKLEGPATVFLPFNRGNKGGRGNPEHPGGYKTAYLWEEIWEKEKWLDIIGNFINIEKKEEEKNGKRIIKESIIFPRYHQLDAVNKILSDTQAKGPGNNYLIQHSAGSGKSITIAWLAHRLSKLHYPDEQKPVFDSVVVVTDRIVLDRQLQESIYQVEHVHGVVQKIDKGSKQLADALAKGSKIIVTTLQKFPFVLEHIEKLPERKYAIIVDEAHSSQTGEMARKLREVLAPDLAVEDIDEEGFDVEEALNKLMQSRRTRLPNLSYYAFTATPRQETVEIFGVPGPDGKPVPFHVYPMRQAIEEGFIMDVLKNYVTYNTYYKLIKKCEDDPDVDRRKAAREMARFVSLHPHNIAQKTEVIIEHFRRVTMKKIGGKAKAMVVTSSRKHAVRYFYAFQDYLRKKNYSGIGVLVAFSGTVEDDGHHYNENTLNKLQGRDIRKAFDTGEYNVLLVAEKFQTGFDQPVLHTMYVDKKLTGLKAVQTLSRLNRVHPQKEDTFILDFVNDPKEIQEAFAVYYDAAEIKEVTDPNDLYDFKTHLDSFGVYRKDEVEKFIKALFRKRQSDMHKHINPSVERFWKLPQNQGDKFKELLHHYLRLYSFLSQIMPFQDKELEQLYLFGVHLSPKLLRRQGESEPINDKVDLEYYRLSKSFEGSISLDKGKTIPEPPDAQKIIFKEKEDKKLAPLSEIIEVFNQRFGTNFSEDDRIVGMFEVSLMKNEKLAESAKVNTKDNFTLLFNEIFDEQLFNIKEESEEFFSFLLENEKARELLKEFLRDRVYERLK
jgi:type I restriction enzyme R subunit